MSPVLFAFASSFLLAGIVAVSFWIFSDYVDNHNEKVLKEYMRRFPGRCSICAVRQHAHVEGRTLRPWPHDCLLWTGKKD